MPQNGLHGLVGLALAHLVAPRLDTGAAHIFVAGATMGAMLPDLDMYPTATPYVAGRLDLVYVLHRTAMHSLAAVQLLGFAGAAIHSRSLVAAWSLWGRFAKESAGARSAAVEEFPIQCGIGLLIRRSSSIYRKRP